MCAGPSPQLLTCVRSNAQAPLFHLATLFRRNSCLPCFLPSLGAPRQGRATNLPIITLHYKAPAQVRFSFDADFNLNICTRDTPDMQLFEKTLVQGHAARAGKQRKQAAWWELLCSMP